MTTYQIGKRLSELRELRGMGQRELAEAISTLDDELPIARDKIAKIETGQRGVSAIELGYLADALAVAPSALAKPVSEGVLFRNGKPTGEPGAEAVRFFEEYVENARAVDLVKRGMRSAGSR